MAFLCINTTDPHPDTVVMTVGAVASLDRCPRCDGEVDRGFGLLGGGYGPYVYCIGTTIADGGDECGFLAKAIVKDGDEMTRNAPGGHDGDAR